MDALLKTPIMQRFLALSGGNRWPKPRQEPDQSQPSSLDDVSALWQLYFRLRPLTETDWEALQSQGTMLSAGKSWWNVYSNLDEYLPSSGHDRGGCQ